MDNIIHPTPELIEASKEYMDRALKKYKDLEHLPNDNQDKLDAMHEHSKAAIIYIRFKTGRSIDINRAIHEQE